MPLPSEKSGSNRIFLLKEEKRKGPGLSKKGIYRIRTGIQAPENPSYLNKSCEYMIQVGYSIDYHQKVATSGVQTVTAVAVADDPSAEPARDTESIKIGENLGAIKSRRIEGLEVWDRKAEASDVSTDEEADLYLLMLVEANKFCKENLDKVTY